MLLEKISTSLAALDSEATVSLSVQAILETVPPQKIILHGLLPGLNEAARRYEKKDHLYPDMYKAARIYLDALDAIKQHIASLVTDKGKWGVIGLANGDMQDFGKNIVHMTLEANGFEVRDLGKSVPAEKFLQAARQGAHFIAISIMTDKGVEESQKVVAELKKGALRDQVKVIVGGAGVNAFKAAEIIGADGYAESADEVVEFLKIFFQAT